MNIRSLSPRARLIAGVAVGGLVVVVLTAVATLSNVSPSFGDAVASTNVLASGTCSQPAVVAAAASAPIIDPTAAASHVTLLWGACGRCQGEQ